MLVYFFVSVVLFMFALFFDSIKNKVTSKYLLLFTIPFLMFNTNNPDFQAYMKIFLKNDPDGISEPGFIILSKIIKFLGGNNYQLMLIVLSVLIVITFVRYSKYITNLNFIVFLYFLFPFVMDIIQLRNTFMVMFLLNAILEYAKEKKLKCILFLVLATLFHSYGYVWIIIILFLNINMRVFNRRNIKKGILYRDNKKYYNTVIMLGLINVIFGRAIVILFSQYFPVARIRQKIPYYLTQALNLDSLIVWGLFLIADIVIFYILIKKITFRNSEIRENNLVNTLYYLLFTGILLIGSLLYIYEINRFFRALFLIKYFLFGAINTYLTRKERFFVKSYLLLVSAMLTVIYYTRGIDYDFIILNNHLFGH